MAGFLDKVAGGISKGVATVGANSKAVMERAKINAAIGNLEGEKNQATLALGQRAYEVLTAGGYLEGDEAAEKLVVEIDKRLALITEQREQLKRVDAEVALITHGTTHGRPAGGIPCGCGHTNPPGTNFCAGCGTKVVAPAVFTCSCGQVNNEGVKFCAGCGTPVAPREG